MKVGLVGPSYQERSLPFDAQRSVNLFVILDKEGKEPSSLYGTPGLDLFSTAGAGPGRGGFSASNGRAFFVSGANLYELDSLGVATSRGTLLTSSGIVLLDENGLQLVISDGASLYIFTYATNVFVRVTDVDLPACGTVTFLDGYFIVNKLSSGQFNISALYDGLTWGALDFATAESSPDELLRVINALGQLWLFGSKTTEVWTNTGASAFPLERIAGAKMEVGILAPYTAVAIDNSVFWVGRDNIGAGIVYRAQGFTPQRISTNPIEIRIQAAPTPSTLRSYTYQEDGHSFYVLTGGGMDTTLVYDISTKLWHERAFLNTEGIFETHLAAHGIYAFNQQLAIDRVNGNIYTQAMDIYSDNGDEIARERIYTHLSNEGKVIPFRNLTVGFETGVGTQTGVDANPLVVLTLSKDGARTWFGEQIKTIGAVGKYLTRVVFQRLGQARQMTFKIRVTSRVKVAITGSYINT